MLANRQSAGIEDIGCWVRGLVVLALVLCASLAHSDAIDDALDHVYENGDYQKELPAAYEPETAPDLIDIEPSDFVLPASAMLLAFYAILAAFGIFVIVILFMLLSGARFPAFNRNVDEDEIEEKTDGKPKRPATIQGWLAAADDLANQGQYGEAIHALLLAVLTRLRERAAMAWRSSTTAREIVNQSDLSNDQEGLLGLLVRSSELAHFGGRDADHDEFAECRNGALKLLEGVSGGPA